MSKNRAIYHYAILNIVIVHTFAINVLLTTVKQNNSFFNGWQ